MAHLAASFVLTCKILQLFMATLLLSHTVNLSMSYRMFHVPSRKMAFSPRRAA